MARPNQDSQPLVEIPDPLQDLVNAFNERTALIQKSVDDSAETYTNQIKEIRQSFSRITSAIILVLVLGFLTLLFALGTVLVAFWQFSSSVTSASNQDKHIEQLTTQINDTSKANSELQALLKKCLDNNACK